MNTDLQPLRSIFKTIFRLFSSKIFDQRTIVVIISSGVDEAIEKLEIVLVMVCPLFNLQVL